MSMSIRTEPLDRFPELLVIVRHGESVRNFAKGNNLYLPTDEASTFKTLSDREVPLTKLGIRQAQQTAERLFEKYGIFDVVYWSGFRRTKQTAEPYVKLVQEVAPPGKEPMKIRVDDDLRERDPGYAYSMTDEEVDRYFPWLKEYWERNGYFDAVPPGGESQAEVCRRIYAFNNRMFRHRAGKKVLIVCHGGIVRAERYNLERWTAKEYMKRLDSDPSPINCGVTTYCLNETTGHLQLESYNTQLWTPE